MEYSSGKLVSNILSDFNNYFLLVNFVYKSVSMLLISN